MALTGWATHVLQWRLQWVAIGQPKANLKKTSQFGLYSATRVHEGGIASNRWSAYSGEYVPGSCTHRPSHHGSRPFPKSLLEPVKDEDAEGRVGD